MIRKFKKQIMGDVTSPETPPQTPPADDLETLKEQLKGMEFDQLAAFAREKGIDLGNTSTATGALGKILPQLEAVQI